MKRSLLVCLSLLPALLHAGAARAEPGRSVVIYEPGQSTCVQSSSLVNRIAAAGQYFPSVLPAAVTTEPPYAPLFRITGEVSALRVRGWGLSVQAESDAAPLGSADSTADLDKTLEPLTCETAEKAVAEILISALSQAPVAAPAPSASPSKAVMKILVAAQRELGGEPALSASVRGDELGLSLVVADAEARCQRGTWLDESAPEDAQLGSPVSRLRQEVLACLQRPVLASPSPVVSPAEPREVDGIFHLPKHAGAAVAGLGVMVSAVAVAGTDESSALLFGALPLVAGGVASYAVPENLRQPVILGGYWLGVAGASLVSASRDRESKSWLIGGALAGGALTSATMAILTGFRRGDEPSLPAWAVALPSTVGAVVAAGSLFTGTDGPRSVPLAALGTLAALIPNAWLFYKLEGDSADRAPRVGALAGSSTVGLVVSGDF